MTLERWQRYTKTRPCPICNGWNAGKKEHQTRCKGFHHISGEGCYCQQVKRHEVLDVHGLVLYWHENLYGAERGPGKTELIGSNTQVPDHSLPLHIEVEKVTRQAKLNWYDDQERTLYETWYVIKRKDLEITRMKHKNLAERYLEVGNNG